MEVGYTSKRFSLVNRSYIKSVSDKRSQFSLKLSKLARYYWFNKRSHLHSQSYQNELKEI